MQKIRTVIYLEKPERDALKKLSAKTGATITELARRAISQYVAKHK